MGLHARRVSLASTRPSDPPNRPRARPLVQQGAERPPERRESGPARPCPSILGSPLVPPQVPRAAALLGRSMAREAGILLPNRSALIAQW